MSIIIGIPTVRRERPYLVQTVASLLQAKADLLRLGCRIVILDAEAEPNTNPAIRTLEHSWSDLIALGLVTVLGRNAATNPDTGELNLKERWQRKQTLDCAELFRRCSGLGDYYLHVEDDVIASPNYLEAITQRVESHVSRLTDWRILSFYNSHPMRDDVPYSESQLYRNYFGLIGQLTRCRDLPDLARYVSAKVGQAPIDVLTGWFVSHTGGRVYPHSPDLFQHVGLISSLQGRTQMWAAPGFEEGLAKKVRREVRGFCDTLVYQPRSMGALAKYKLGISGKWWRRRAVG